MATSAARAPEAAAAAALQLGGWQRAFFCPLSPTHRHCLLAALSRPRDAAPQRAPSDRGGGVAWLWGGGMDLSSGGAGGLGRAGRLRYSCLGCSRAGMSLNAPRLISLDDWCITCAPHRDARAVQRWSFTKKNAIKKPQDGHTIFFLASGVFGTEEGGKRSQEPEKAVRGPRREWQGKPRRSPSLRCGPPCRGRRGKR